MDLIAANDNEYSHVFLLVNFDRYSCRFLLVCICLSVKPAAGRISAEPCSGLSAGSVGVMKHVARRTNVSST